MLSAVANSVMVSVMFLLYDSFAEAKGTISSNAHIICTQGKQRKIK